MRNWLKTFWHWLRGTKPKCDYCEQPAMWKWTGMRSTAYTEYMVLCDRCADRRSEVAKTLLFISWSTTKF